MAWWNNPIPRPLNVKFIERAAGSPNMVNALIVCEHEIWPPDKIYVLKSLLDLQPFWSANGGSDHTWSCYAVPPFPRCQANKNCTFWGEQNGVSMFDLLLAWICHQKMDMTGQVWCDFSSLKGLLQTPLVSRSASQRRKYFVKMLLGPHTREGGVKWHKFNKLRFPRIFHYLLHSKQTCVRVSYIPYRIDSAMQVKVNVLSAWLKRCNTWGCLIQTGLAA